MNESRRSVSGSEFPHSDSDQLLPVFGNRTRIFHLYARRRRATIPILLNPEGYELREYASY